MNKIISFTCILFSILSCSKEEEQPVIVPEIPSNIYIVGKAKETTDGTTRPVIWKNGKATFLSATDQEGTANAIVGKNGNIYVVGYAKNANDRWQGIYWKNKIPQNVNVDPNTDSFFYSISVYNNDVYILGTSNHEIRYWKNGVENTPIGIENMRPVKIIVNRNGAYILVYDGDNGTAKLWKNGNVTNLSNNDPSFDDPKDFCIVNNDIYVVAKESGTGIKYWKNGVVKYLTATSYDAHAESINVINNAVYISGSDDNDKAAYWKNGTPIPLEDTNFSSHLWTSTIFNGNLFSAGTINAQMTTWKNNKNTNTTLTTFESVPYGIFVTN